MKFIVYFTAYHWDNYQGGSGKYISHRINLEFSNSNFMIWEHIHNAIKTYLKANRAFDQSVYSKNQGEYTIEKAELL